MGEILVEVMAEAVGDGFRQPMVLIGPFPSGAPAIFIDQVAKLDQLCGIIGCVGDDDFGLLTVERLRHDGVDVSAVQVDPDQTTGTAFVRYRDDGERDFIYHIRNSASGRLTLTEPASRMLDECEHIHVTGSSLFSADIIETAKKAVALVKRNGGTFSFDPNIRKEMLQSPGMRATLEEMVRLCDVFLPSAAELAMLASGDEEVERVGEVFGLGVSRVVVKRGPDGASYHDPTGSLQAAGFLVEAVDPTGAGDCFDAAFTTCWLQRRSPEESVRYANAAGASAVRVRGPMEGTATFAQLDALIAAAGPAVATAE